jgi:hypothetical protein
MEFLEALLDNGSQKAIIYSYYIVKKTAFEKILLQVI